MNKIKVLIYIFYLNSEYEINLIPLESNNWITNDRFSANRYRPYSISTNFFFFWLNWAIKTGKKKRFRHFNLWLSQIKLKYFIFIYFFFFCLNSSCEINSIPPRPRLLFGRRSRGTGERHPRINHFTPAASAREQVLWLSISHA